MTKYKNQLNELREKGFVSAEVSFYGGGDEGGAEEMELIRADGTTQDLTYDDPMWALLEEPIEDEYGGFAGDFSVSGKVIYDVEQGTVKMERSEQQWGPEETLDL